MDVEEKFANFSIREDNSPTDRATTKASLTSADSEQSGNESHANSSRTFSTGSETDVEYVTKQKFMQLVTKARQLTEQGDITGAIKLNEKALAIRFSEKLEKRIAKMKAYLAEQEKNDDEVEEDDQMKSLGQGFMLHHKLYAKLYTHQKEGALWMWSLYLLGKGGILADDMGLGKTIQVIAFLAGMFDMNKIKSVMIVVPLSVMPNWLNEFNKWTPGISVMQFHGGSKKEKERALHRVRTRGGVLMTTYGLVITTNETFAVRHGQEFIWDYVILDEGHKIKNPTKTSKSVHLIPARHRIILTGTPVQNNLKELWALFDYVHQGSLLGTVRTFKMEFETPITRARERDASAMEKKLGQEMAETLKKIIKPYFLRRTKAEVSDKKDDGRVDSKELRMPTMTRKNDIVIWLHLTTTQQQIYQDFINLEDVKELLMTKKSPLVALTVLKKICDHPRLLSTRACLQLGLDGDNFDEEILEHPESYQSAVTQIDKIPDDVLINESGKMQILVSLLDTFKGECRQTLVFSQSRKLLDIIQKIITHRGHKVLRLDGTVTQLAERDEIVKKFQRDPSYSVFLLTVQVGGVGLTITAADRVIIYDPNWNPATDAQAVDRVYRIGQQKNVVVYRLITCGTVEEKIYRRQVFKDSITRQTTGSSKNPYRYFTKMELKELFTLDDPRFSKTQKQLQELHGNQRQSDTELDEHIAYLHSLDIFGISDHDLMFKQTSVRDDEEDDMIVVGEEEEENNARLIQHRVATAQKLLTEESTVPISYEERSKGMMRYKLFTATTYTAPSGAPKPSPLFSQVSSSKSDESNEDELNESGSTQNIDDLVPEVVDLTVADSDESGFQGDNTKQTQSVSKASKPSAHSPSTSVKERRVLQPLSSEEVHQRSPQTTIVHKRGEIISEELLISPDNCSPIIGLEKTHSRRRVMEECARTGSFPSSPVKITLASPRSHGGKSVMSPSRFAGSPSKDVHSSSKFASPRSHLSSPRRLNKEPNLRRSLFPLDAPSTPPASREILVEESPTSSLQTPSPSSKTRFDALSSPLDVELACRKLSLIVADSVNNSPAATDQSPVKNFEHSPCLVTKNKHRSGSPSESLSLAADVDASMTQESDEGCELLKNNFDEKKNSGSSVVALDSTITNVRPAGDHQLSSSSSLMYSSGVVEGYSRKVTSNNRRSVCLQKPVLDDDDDDEDSLDDSTDVQDEKPSDESKNESNDFNEEASLEEDEEDKENDPVLVKRIGGRNRIISESESESGSCFEVEVSEEDEEQSLDTCESEENTAQAKVNIKEEESKLQGEVERNDGGDDMDNNSGEEEEEEDEGKNERFQILIQVARKLYKEKKFTDSLVYVEEALMIFKEPELEVMADKIRLKVQQSQQ